MAGTLSGGEQQMCAIGRGLMSEPQLLMLDEPSLGLAPKLVDEIFEFITNIARQGVTILLVGQNVNYTLQISHYGYVMETGRITLEGPTEMLMNNEFVRRAYLGIAEEHPPSECPPASGIDQQPRAKGRDIQRSPLCQISSFQQTANQNWNMSPRSLPIWFRAFKGGSPNVPWMNLSIETSSICTCEM